MMRMVRVFGFLSLAFAASILALGSPLAEAQRQVMSQPKPKQRTVFNNPALRSSARSASRSAPIMASTGGTHVYLLRGWLDVFSTGMDDLTAKLNRRGIRASAHGHVEYHALADAIAARYRTGRGERVVIIGHSLGANAAVEMAARLGELKVPVPLVITYDPTVVEHAPANVSRLVNFYQSNNGWGNRVASGPGFRGSLSNIDLARDSNLDHVSIDKSNRLHIQSIGYIQSLGGGRQAAAAKPAPSTPSEAKEPAPAPAQPPAAVPAHAKETAPASSQTPVSVPDSSPPL